MIGESLSEFVIVATIGLVTLPILARILWRGLRPVEHTRFNLVSLITGTGLLLAALIACATALVLVIDGGLIVTHHVLPWDAFISAVSAVLVAVLVAVLATGWRTVRRSERLLRIEPSVATHKNIGDIDVVLLDTHEPLAYTLGGRRQQVVVSRGLVDTLTNDELRSVVEHEIAHLRLGHHRHLHVIGLLAPLARYVGLLGRIVDSARVAIEQAADAHTTDPHSTKRALLALSGVPSPLGANGFAGTAIVDRLQALDDRPGSSTSRRALLYGAALLLVAASTSGLIEFIL